MAASNAPSHHLDTLFSETVTVDAIAEDLQGAHPNKDATDLRDKLDEENFDVYGVKARSDGMLGYVLKEDLHSGEVEQHRRDFTAEHLISASTPLIEVLDLIVEESPLFVLSGSEVGRIVTRADLHKPPVRMLIYGVVTRLEMEATEFIDQHYDGDWIGPVRDEAFKTAQRTHEKRKERDEETRPVACLPFGAKLDLLRCDETALDVLGESREQADDAVPVLVDIRNDVAHGHEVSGHDWPTIVEHIHLAWEWTQALEQALDEDQG